MATNTKPVIVFASKIINYITIDKVTKSSTSLHLFERLFRHASSDVMFALVDWFPTGSQHIPAQE